MCAGNNTWSVFQERSWNQALHGLQAEITERMVSIRKMLQFFPSPTSRSECMEVDFKIRFCISNFQSSHLICSLYTSQQLRVWPLLLCNLIFSEWLLPSWKRENTHFTCIYIHTAHTYIYIYKESFSLFISTVRTIVHQSRCCSIILIVNVAHTNVIIPFGISGGTGCTFLRDRQKVLHERRKTFSCSSVTKLSFLKK